MRGDAHGGGAWTDLGVPVRKLSLRPFQTTLRLVLAIAPSARRRHLPRRDTRHVGARSCRARCALRPAGREAHAGRRRRTKAPAVPVSRHQQRPRATTSPPSSLAADDQSTVSGHLPRREAVRHELSSPSAQTLCITCRYREPRPVSCCSQCGSQGPETAAACAASGACGARARCRGVARRGLCRPLFSTEARCVWPAARGRGRKAGARTRLRARRRAIARTEATTAVMWWACRARQAAPRRWTSRSTAPSGSTSSSRK